MKTRRLAECNSFSDPGSRGFRVKKADTGVMEIFVVHKAGQFSAYLNQCPHRGMPLEWRPDEFLDDEGEHIICATHGALFAIEDGACLGGPCRGRGLTPVALERLDDALYLAPDCGLEVIET